MTGAQSTAPTVVDLDHVTVRYGGALALCEVSLTVRAGERVAVLGPSGAGKSTLLGLLTGTVRATTGTVTVLGRRPAELSGGSLRRLRGRIGTMHQQLDLVGPLRVVHNVNAGNLAHWSLARAAWTLLRPREGVGAAAALGRVGLGGRVFHRTDSLSGGEQQRVALARLLVQDPELVLADEPVSSLDPALSAQVLRLLTEVVAGRQRTLLVSLHDPALALRFCDRVIGLRDGAVLFDLRAAAVAAGSLDALYGADR